MEVKDIIDTKLIAINKTDSNNDLIFEKPKSRTKFRLEFKGLLFETPYPVLNKKVENINLEQAPGFKALTQLKFLRLNPSGYKQLLIQMHDLNSEHKIELICVFKNIKLNKLT